MVVIPTFDMFFSTLISAFDKAKKKYQSKLKKLEAQMQSLTERYETQVNIQALQRLESTRIRWTFIWRVKQKNLSIK